MKKAGLNSWRSWTVAVGYAVVYCMLATVYRLAALFYAAFVEQFHIDRKSASIPFVVLGFLRCSSGSIYGILGERFGLQRMALVGCYISVIGLFASFFAKDVIALSITIGLMYGFGMTCTALLPSIIRCLFDDTTTSISNGIVNFGPAFCGVAFPGVIMYFLDVYGVSGALLLSSGILLNTIPLVMLLKIFGRSNTSMVQTTATHHDNKNIQSAGIIENMNINENYGDHPQKQKSNAKPGIVTITSSFVEKKIPKCLQHDREACLCLRSIQNKYMIQTSSEPNKFKQIQKQDNKKDIANYSNYNEQEMIHQSLETTNKIASKNHKDNNNGLFYSLNVLKDPTFIALLLIQGMFFYGQHVWITTLIDFSRDKGIDRSYEIYILTLNPISDIIGRLGVTWVTDRGYLTTGNFCALLFITLFVSSILMAVANNFAMLTCGIMLTTFAGGAIINVSPGMSYAYIEKDKQILSISSFGLLNAPLIFTMSPLIGYFRENLGSYDGLYYLLAVLYFASSLISLMLPKLANLRERKKTKKAQNNASFEIN